MTKNPVISYLRINSVLFFIMFILKVSIAQDVSGTMVSGQFRKQSLPVFFHQLSEQYGIRFFFQPQWIDTISIDRDFRETPLVQVMNSLFRNTNITWRTFQDDALVIFPVPVNDSKSTLDEMQFLVIGDPRNEGRYKKATLKGRLLDGKNGNPLPGAVIQETRSRKGTSTDAGGYFTFELATGEGNLQFSYLGYQPVHQKIRLIENGYAEFDIFEESHNIAEVTITGKDADLPRAQMSLISMEVNKIKELPVLMGEVDIMRGMTMQAGVQTVSELSSGFNIRGGNTDQNLLMINGSPVFNASHLFGFLSLINPDLVNEVRLFKGGMPARYGERVASVMEVDIKDGNDETLRLAGGLGIINSRLSIDGPLSKNKKLTLTAGGRSSYSNWVIKQVPNPDISQSIAGFYDVAGKLTYKFNPHNRISGMFYLSSDEYSTSTQSTLGYGSLLGTLQLRNRFTDRLTGDGNMAFSRYKYRLTDLADGKSEEAYYLDNQLQYSSLKYNLRYHFNEKSTVEGGFNAMYYLIHPGEVTGKADPSLIVPTKLHPEKALEWAGYLSSETEITPRFSLSLGLRMSSFSSIGTPVVYLYDPEQPRTPGSVIDSLTFAPGEISKTYRQPEPRLLFRYEIKPGKILKLNFQRISQYIFQLSNNAVISPADTWKTSDYHLKPLISDQVALGIEIKTLPKAVELSFETYFKKLRNLLEYKNGANILMNPHIETGLIPSVGYSYGFEFQAQKNSGRLTGWFNYTFSRTMRKTNSLWKEEQLRSGTWYPSEYDRPHDFSTGATYNISRRWRFSGNFEYISGRPVTLPERLYRYAGESLVYYSERNKYRMPSYHRLDVAVTLDENLRKKRMWKGSWTFSVYNVYGRHNPYSVYYRKTIPSAENNYRIYSMFKLSVIGVPVPSLTYNFKF